MNKQKTKRDENFLVGSPLIPRRLRATVHAYYMFARYADDIADSPDLTRETKKNRLSAMKSALAGVEPRDSNHAEDIAAARTLGTQLTERGLDLSLASDLLEAFLWDADNNPCRTWADLINYCQYSACPVGRFLLALHEEKTDTPESDTLCSALQILNHVQDASRDWQTLQRVYMPTDWIEGVGEKVDGLGRETASPELRTVYNRVLDNTDVLIASASKLPNLIRNRGLAAEATICVALAKRLSSRLRRIDPIGNTVSLTAFDWAYAATTGLARLLRP
ncbi:MAG: squalene/phytoene synthase family protein [Rhodospirillaceae bacterium]|nr:squalene/phytoene synthase family protein [Rhodospirillaceae bacterium]